VEIERAIGCIAFFMFAAIVFGMYVIYKIEMKRGRIK